MPHEQKPKQQVWLARWRRALITGVIIVGVGGYWGWQSLREGPHEVLSEVATLGPVTRLLAVNGKIAAQTSVQIRASVSATVLDLLVQEGDAVTKGQVLARLDDTQQRAVVQQAISTLQGGQIQQAQAEATYSRSLELGSLIARSKLEDAQRSLDGAEQEVARLSAILEQAKIQLARYTVQAPIAGTVIARSVDLGQLVDASTALFTLADLSELIVETDVDESYGTQIALGQAAKMRLVGSRTTLEGAVTFVSPKVDAATGGLAVKIGFAAPLSAPVGLTVTANIVVDQRDGITVPRAALMGDAVFLYVDGKAKRTPVSYIDWPAARLIVTDGLKAGDLVIMDSTGLSDGLTVKLGKL